MTSHSNFLVIWDNSRDLCSAIALLTEKLCLKRYCGNDGSLEAFLACKLIMTAFRRNILGSAGDLQLCAGQRAGCEVAVHALSSMFSKDKKDAILLVDADNTFNRINRKVMLHNIRIICPIIATYVINLYSQEARLFISGGEEVTSVAGTTQGDPTAMPIYALRSLPLLNIITTDSKKHDAYADEISCVRKLRNILTWWNKLYTFSPKTGYFLKTNKSWLIVNPEKYETAKGIFKDTNLNITNEGKRHLGAAVVTGGVQKGICDHESKRMGNRIKVTYKSC